MTTAEIETQSITDKDRWLVTDFEKAGQLFHETRSRVSNLFAAKLLWSLHFRKSERKLERKVLGGTFETAINEHRTAVGMWKYVYGGSFQKAVIEVGKEIGVLEENRREWLLREAGEPSDNPGDTQAEAIFRDDRATQREPRQISPKLEGAQSKAIDQGGLVIERSSRSVYWRRELIDVDWWRKHCKSWGFLVLACEHAQRNETIDRLSFGDKSRKNIVTQEKWCLKNIPGFPKKIIDYFQYAGSGTQKFAIPKGKLRIFD